MEPQSTEEGARAFLNFLAGLADGEAQHVLSDELHKLGMALRDESEARRATVKGSLTLTIGLTAKAGTVEAGYDVKTTTPKPARATSVMWLTNGGNFTPTNPKQTELPGVREVPRGDNPARDVTAPQPAREV